MTELIEAVARGIEPETFDLPRINLNKPVFERAYRRAQAALTAITDAGYRIVPGWQPIETAPEETNVIVAVTGGPHGATVCEAYFHRDDEYGAEWWLASTGPANYYHGPISDIMHGSVTHWMPLPAAPGDEK